MNKQTEYSNVKQLPQRMGAGVKLGLLAALAFAGVLVSAQTAGAQSLAELLCAVQKRQQLLIDRDKSEKELNSDSTDLEVSYTPPKNPIELIDWGIGTDFPADSDVNSLSIETRIQLLQKAYNALNYLSSEYFSIGLNVHRSLMDIQDSLSGSDGCVPITLANYQEYLRAMSRWVGGLQETDWPIRYQRCANETHIDGRPESPISLNFSTDGVPFGDDVDSSPSAHFGIETRGDTTRTTVWGEYCTEEFARGAANYPGHVNLYVSPGFWTLAANGLTLNLSGFSDSSLYQAGDYLFNAISTQDDSNIDIGKSPGILGGKTSGASINGKWVDSLDYAPVPKYQTSQDLIKDLAEFLYFDVGGVGISIKSRFKPNFGTEFSSSLPNVPKRAPTLEITPDFSNSRILVSLSNRADNHCSLIWNFALDAVASRNVIQAGGSGDWDAVYSGKPEDREPELVWTGGEFTKNGRWANFEDYIGDWWRPVLKQLVCDTYGVNIVQEGRFQYEIDFYRRDQFGSKDATTGEYDFSGAVAVDTFVVSNPDSDDSHAGVLQIVVHKGQANEATYNLTLTQQLDSNQNVTESDWVFTGPSLSKSVEVTPANATYDSSSETYQITQKKTVVDTTTLDGVAQPKVTTTYWEWPTTLGYQMPRGEWIDTITESSPADGTRTTRYTYGWEDQETYSGSGVYYHGIDHLTGVTQTGGSNPYTASYDAAGQLTSYSDTWGSEDVTYSGNTVTRTQKINGQPVRTLVTTYSGDMSTATTTAQ